MWQGLPSITTGEWGTCAFVGLSDAVLRRSDGADIDQHDTWVPISQSPKEASAGLIRLIQNEQKSPSQVPLGLKATIVIS